jgi:hypothetical protein
MQPVRDQEPVAQRIPEARYAYYRRCQEFCKSGEQCKAPAEKGALICHAHAGQRAMAARREAERRAVLERAAAEMRRRTRQHYTAAEMLMSFNGIQTTLAVAAQALIDGSLSCKTAGRLLMDLQCMAKLLRTYEKAKAQTTQDTKEHKGLVFGKRDEPPMEQVMELEIVRAANACESARIIDFVMADRREAFGFKEWLKAA